VCGKEGVQTQINWKKGEPRTSDLKGEHGGKERKLTNLKRVKTSESDTAKGAKDVGEKVDSGVCKDLGQSRGSDD